MLHTHISVIQVVNQTTSTGMILSLSVQFHNCHLSFTHQHFTPHQLVRIQLKFHNVDCSNSWKFGYHARESRR